VGGLGVVAVPSYAFGPLVHGLVILLAAVPAITAAVAAAWGVWTARPPQKGLRFFAAATLLTTVACVAIFARQLSLGTETTFGLAALEKVAMLLAAGWMVLTCTKIGAMQEPLPETRRSA
jgi:hypothetical protein